MRTVGLSDLDIAARAVLAVSREHWTATAERLVNEAHMADLWRKRHGTAHPNGGTGSLYVQATLGPTVGSSDCTAQYCAALCTVMKALKAWRIRCETGTDHET